MCCKPTPTYICKTLVILVFALMVSFIIVMESVNPSSVKFDITRASLTHFNLTSNNILLYYNFKVNITERNPNKYVKVSYRWIIAFAYYKDNKFDCASPSLGPFNQAHKSTTFLGLGPLVFEGQSRIQLNPRRLAEYNEETRVGIYNDLAMQLDLRVIFKYGPFRHINRSQIYECRGLRFPLISSGESAPTFNVIICSCFIK